MNKFVLLLLVTSITLGAVTLHLVRELRAERDNRQKLQSHIDALENAQPPAPAVFSVVPLSPEPAITETRAPAAESSTRASLPAPAGVLAAPPASGQTAPSHEERMRMIRESAQRQRALMRDPDYRDAMLTQHKMMLASSYPDLAAEMQFAPEQAEQFTTLLAEQQLRSMEDQEPWVGGPPDPAAMGEMQRKALERQQANEAELAALLGQDKLAAWKEYQSTLGARRQAADLRNKLANKGAPLREDQVKPLQRALADAQQRMMDEWRRNPQPRGQMAFVSGSPGIAMAGAPDAAARFGMQEDQLRRMEEHNEHLRDSLASVLTLEQLRYFEEEQNAQLRIQQAHLRMMRAQAEAEARGEISSPTSSNSLIYSGNAILSSP